MASSKDNMKARLDEKKKKESPTGALLQSFEDSPIDQSEKDYADQFKELSKKKQKVEDTHTRKTFLVRNDLVNRLDEIAERSHHGFKTEFINTAIEYVLDEIEKNH